MITRRRSVVLLLALTPTLLRADAAPWWERTRETAGQMWERTVRWVSGEPGGESALADLWEDLVPKLDETLQRQEEARTLPESSWFRRDRRSAQAEIDALLDEAVEILSRTPGLAPRARIRELDRRIEALRRENDEYRLKKVAAPRDSLWRKTIDEYDRAIADNKARIAALEQQLAREKADFAANLRAMGLEIDPEALDVLLASVVGDDLIRMAVVFDNVRKVTEQLERLMAESGERAEAARRYYGMYTVLLRVLIHMHETMLARIRNDYLPRIHAITERTSELHRQTRRLLRRDPRDRRVLEANLQAQALTLEAARQYGDYLQGQAAELDRRMQGLRRDLEVAQNTYETVKLSGELLALMRASRESLAALARLQMPELRGFHNRELREEFRRLTERLRAGA